MEFRQNQPIMTEVRSEVPLAVWGRRQAGEEHGGTCWSHDCRLYLDLDGSSAKSHPAKGKGTSPRTLFYIVVIFEIVLMFYILNK